MATLAQFSRNIRKRGSQIQNSGTSYTKVAAKSFLRSAVLGTKVDKGVARSNWRVGIGSPTRAVIEAYVPYPKGSKGAGQGMMESGNAAGALGAGNARINSVRGVAGVGLTTAIYVSNNVPYPNTAFPPGLVESALLGTGKDILGVRVFS